MTFSKLTDIIPREALEEIEQTNDLDAVRILIDYLMLKLDYGKNSHEKLNIIEAINKLMEVKKCMIADTSK